MAIDIAQLVGGAFGGAVASSVLAPLIGQRKERRDLRASVLRWVGELERRRWADSSSRDEFREAVVALRAAALIAAAQRDVIDHYIFLAQVARQASDAAMEYTDGDPQAAGIPTPLFDLVADAATLVVDHLWHPYRKRVAVARGLKKNRTVERALRDDEEMPIGWSPPLVYG